MSTRIVFDNGLKLTVAQNEADVAEALRRDRRKEVTLEGRSARQLHINWDHVVFIEPASAAAARRSPISRAGTRAAAATSARWRSL